MKLSGELDRLPGLVDKSVLRALCGIMTKMQCFLTKRKGKTGVKESDREGPGILARSFLMSSDDGTPGLCSPRKESGKGPVFP
jgi:hypothetical protein